MLDTSTRRKKKKGLSTSNASGRELGQIQLASSTLKLGKDLVVISNVKHITISMNYMVFFEIK